MNNWEDAIYKSITKKEIQRLFLVGGIIGAVIFLICYGWKILDVTYDSWLLSGDDISQHYIGWKFYRECQWSFPVGKMDNILYPSTSCIIFTDSIPILAIFFKLLSPILPDTFQYFGIWGCLSYFLTGALSAVIVRKSTQSQWNCYISAALFAFSPYILQRMYSHTSLAGHWIILAAILIWIYKPYFYTLKRQFLAWSSLLIVGSLVHIYFIPMIMLFMFGFCLQDVLENNGWKKDLIFAPVCIVLDVAVLMGVGAFSKGGGYQDSGLGVYSANLNSLFNSNKRTRFFGNLLIREGQDEGFGYLGAGILLLLGCAIGIYVIYKIRNVHQRREYEDFCRKNSFSVSLVIVLAISFLLACSPTVTFGNKILFGIPYPDFVLKILETFRASGRFIWCVGYIIMFWSVMTICFYLKGRKIYVFMLAALLLQILDIQPMIEDRRSVVNSQNQFSVLKSDKWEELALGKEHVVILPYSTVQGINGVIASYEIGNFAADHRMTINYFPVARIDLEEMALNDRKYMDNTIQNLDRKKCLYIIDTEEKGTFLGLTVQKIDGYLVGIAP